MSIDMTVKPTYIRTATRYKAHILIWLFSSLLLFTVVFFESRLTIKHQQSALIGKHNITLKNTENKFNNELAYITNIFQNISQDHFFLMKIEEAIRTNANNPSFITESLKTLLMSHLNIYQIRWVDSTGNERVKINKKTLRILS